MNNELTNYARTLNKHDKKNLSQKLTKTVEEIGELARVVLPFEDASGTLHRFVERKQILEEVIDVILCAQSIAHELEFSDDEIEEMYKLKLEKWAALQAAEELVNNKPIPFEVHITVQLPAGASIDSFVAACKQIGVKPIVLELQSHFTDSIQDVMTSSVHFGSNRSAYGNMIDVSSALTKRGYRVVRSKIETVPWHPASPKTPGDDMPKNCYFESHVAVVVHSSEQRTNLSRIAKEHSAHLSRNALKHIHGTSYINMITLRSNTDTQQSFTNKLNFMISDLKDQQFEVDKEIIEFAIYDTNVSHDASWITGT